MKSNFFRMLTLVALVAAIGCTSEESKKKAASNSGSSTSTPADSDSAPAEKARVVPADSGKNAAVVTPKTKKKPIRPVVGELAPEITGPDTDGEVFNLSDYRGKVVMIDFWGNW